MSGGCLSRRDRSVSAPPRPFPGAEIVRALGAGLAALLTLLPTGLVLGGAAGTPTIPVSITSSADPADAGLPFELVAIVPGSVGQYFFNWTDSQGGSSSAPTWEVDIDVPGNLTVTLAVWDPAGDRGAASLTIPIHPALSLTVGSPLSQVDAGVPVPFFIDVMGGVPPITASWVSSDGGSNGSAGWPADGNYSEEADFSPVGPAWILVRAVDALGDPTSTAELVAEVVPPGAAAFATNGTFGEVGWPLGVVAVVEDGAPPFHWSLASSLPLADGAGPFGAFPSDGRYGWSLRFATPGTAFLNLTLVDGLGAVSTSATVVTVEPPLSVNVTSPGLIPSTPFDITANVAGGLPPYVYQFRLSDGEGFNGTLVSPGAVATVFDPPSVGNYTVDIRVVDELGQTWFSSELLRTSGAVSPTSFSPGGDATTVAGVLTLTVAGALAALYLYHRFRKRLAAPRPVAESALRSVRQLMERSQIIDRETLVLLGEEAGDSADAVQTALQTLIRTGEVTSEPGPGDDEVLRWKATEGPGEPSEDRP